MKFVTLDSETFRAFASNYRDKSFYQTPEIAKLREKGGWTTYYFGIEEKGNIIAGSMIAARPTFLGKSVFYAPGGLLVDYENEELLNFFTKHLKSYLRTHNGYVLHIEPYYELIERDRHGEIVEGGFNHENALQNLKKLGYIRLAESDEPKYSFALEINGQTEEQIFSDMKRNTRNHIRKAEKMGVTIRELKREELGIFKQITESTSNRRNFTDKPLSYYEEMYDLFHSRDEVKFLVAEAKLGENTSNSIPLSVAMFITYGNEVIYLFSGSDEKYMKEYNAQYLIQWHMIKYAVNHGFKRYNFYGIQGLPDKTSKDYGIYDFKKGFTSDRTGRVIELIGAHELPINSLFYKFHQILSKIKH